MIECHKQILTYPSLEFDRIVQRNTTDNVKPEVWKAEKLD